jgi:hypothetical protein
MTLLNNPINLELPTLPLNPDAESMQSVLWQAEMQWFEMVGVLPPAPSAERPEVKED